MRTRLISLLAAVPLLLGVSAAPHDVHYAALGDSFAAGVGAGRYDGSSGDCHRSARSYPALWRDEHHPVAFEHLACGGAGTAEVLRDQLPRVPEDSDVITLTVGGNDLGFAEAVIACLQPLTTDGTCDHVLDTSEQRLTDELPGLLSTLYQAIAAKAPDARVVVTGYPRLLRTGTTCSIGTDRRRERFDALADRLDDLIRRQSEKQGFEFVDVRDAFTGHAACNGGHGEWIRGISWPLWESFHPTATGQAEGYLPVVSAALGG